MGAVPLRCKVGPGQRICRDSEIRRIYSREHRRRGLPRSRSVLSSVPREDETSLALRTNDSRHCDAARLLLAAVVHGPSRISRLCRGNTKKNSTVSPMHSVFRARNLLLLESGTHFHRLRDLERNINLRLAFRLDSFSLRALGENGELALWLHEYEICIV